MKKYLWGVLSRIRNNLGKKPYVLPLTLLVLGLTTFSSVAYYNLKSNNITKKDNTPAISTLNVTENKEKGEVAGTDTVDSSPTPANITPAANPTSTPTPPTEKPGEVKEIHTKEVVEEKTVVVVTATPTNTPTPTLTPTQTPTPTPDNTPFEASISSYTQPNGNGYSIFATITANKPLDTCGITLCKNDGGLCVGGGVIDGNVCTQDANFSSSSGAYVESGGVCSLSGECKYF